MNPCFKKTLIMSLHPLHSVIKSHENYQSNSENIDDFSNTSIDSKPKTKTFINVKKPKKKSAICLIRHFNVYYFIKLNGK